MNEQRLITSAKEALLLMNQNILISKSFGGNSALYAKSADGNILVINENKKYYIDKYQFMEDFNLSTFYIYKSLDNVEIDQEFRKLRQ